MGPQGPVLPPINMVLPPNGGAPGPFMGPKPVYAATAAAMTAFPFQTLNQGLNQINYFTGWNNLTYNTITNNIYLSAGTPSQPPFFSSSFSTGFNQAFNPGPPQPDLAYGYYAPQPIPPEAAAAAAFIPLQKNIVSAFFISFSLIY